MEQYDDISARDAGVFDEACSACTPMSYAHLCGSLLLGGGVIDLILLCDYIIHSFLMGVPFGNALPPRIIVMGAIVISFILVGVSLIHVSSRIHNGRDMRR